MNKDYAVVELTDGTVTSISLDRYLASKMTIIEECTFDTVEEKTSYWERVYNYRNHRTKESFRYHFYNPRLKRHLYTNTLNPAQMNGLRGKKGYRLVC